MTGRAKCDNCELQLSSTDGPGKKFGFCSLVPNRKVKLIDAFEIIFPAKSGPHHLDNGVPVGDRALCRTCVQILGNMYKSFCNFRKHSKSDSYCHKKYLTDTTTLNNANNSSSPENLKPRTFVSSAQQTKISIASKSKVRNVKTQTRLTQQKLISALTRSNSKCKGGVGKKQKETGELDRKQSFYRSVRAMVNKEVQYLTRHKDFNTKPDRENLLPPEDKVGEILSNECPLVLAVLQGLCLKLKLKNDCTPQMTTVLGIALFSQNHMCNILQKFVGLALWKTMASEEVRMYICYVHMYYNMLGFQSKGRIQLLVLGGVFNLEFPNPPEAEKVWGIYIYNLTLKVRILESKMELEYSYLTRLLPAQKLAPITSCLYICDLPDFLKNIRIYKAIYIPTAYNNRYSVANSI
jgi:hypothetical protein